MTRVFFDSSVIIAALLSGKGASALLMELSCGGVIFGVTSVGCLEEVLSKNVKLNKTSDEIVDFFKRSGLVIREKVKMEEIQDYLDKVPDPNDAHVVAGANLSKCGYLVTLDKKHLLSPETKKKLLPLIVVSPGELLGKLV